MTNERIDLVIQITARTRASVVWWAHSGEEHMAETAMADEAETVQIVLTREELDLCITAVISCWKEVRDSGHAEPALLNLASSLWAAGDDQLEGWPP